MQCRACVRACGAPNSTPRVTTRTQVANVALVPGDAFGAPTCIRISYAASMETLAEALDRVAGALAPGKITRSSSA